MVGNEILVFYSIVSEFMDSEKIGFGKRVVDVEDFREEVDDFRSVL